MIENFIYAWTANQLSAAIRLIPMGSIKAQTIQLELLDLISEVSQEIVDSNINDLYVGNISLSMAQQNHNDLYTKLCNLVVCEISVILCEIDTKTSNTKIMKTF